MKTFLPFMLIVATLLGQGGTSGMLRATLPTAGTYNAPQVRNQIFQMDIDRRGNGTYKVIVTLHTPPTIVDQRPFKGHVNAQGLFCISPAPAHFAGCFQVLNATTLRTVEKDPAHAVKLTRYQP